MTPSFTFLPTVQGGTMGPQHYSPVLAKQTSSTLAKCHRLHRWLEKRHQGVGALFSPHILYLCSLFFSCGCQLDVPEVSPSTHITVFILKYGFCYSLWNQYGCPRSIKCLPLSSNPRNKRKKKSRGANLEKICDSIQIGLKLKSPLPLLQSLILF